MDMRESTNCRYAIAFGLFAAIFAQPLDGQWVEPPRQGWASVAFYYLDTSEQFGVTGDSRPIELEGHAQTASTFFTVR